MQPANRLPMQQGPGNYVGPNAKCSAVACNGMEIKLAVQSK